MKENTYLMRSWCPSCNMEASICAQEVSSTPSAESISYNDLKNFYDDTFKEKAFAKTSFQNGERVFFSYYRCRQCQLLFCRKFFSHSQLEEICSNTEDNSGGLSVDLLRKTHNGYFRLLKKYTDLGGHYLEIGPDTGLFAKICAEHGHFERFWLFECNRQSWVELKKNMENRQYTIFPNMFDLNPVPDGILSLSVMTHVLDHLANPRTMLEEIRRKMKPSGILMIITHNESSFLPKIIGKSWPPYSLFHPQLFNPKSTRNLLDAAGFSIIQIMRTKNYFPVDHLVNHGLKVIGLPQLHLPLLSTFHMPVKLGNIMTIAYPKQ